MWVLFDELQKFSQTTLAPTSRGDSILDTKLHNLHDTGFDNTSSDWYGDFDPYNDHEIPDSNVKFANMSANEDDEDGYEDWRYLKNVRVRPVTQNTSRDISSEIVQILQNSPPNLSIYEPLRRCSLMLLKGIHGSSIGSQLPTWNLWRDSKP